MYVFLIYIHMYIYIYIHSCLFRHLYFLSQDRALRAASEATPLPPLGPGGEGDTFGRGHTNTRQNSNIPDIVSVIKRVYMRVQDLIRILFRMELHSVFLWCFQKWVNAMNIDIVLHKRSFLRKACRFSKQKCLRQA